MDSRIFILCLNLQSNTVIYLVTQILSALVIVSSFWLALTHLGHTPSFGFWSPCFSFFLAQQAAPGPLCAFPAQPLETAISPKSSGSLFCRMVLEPRAGHWCARCY